VQPHFSWIGASSIKCAGVVLRPTAEQTVEFVRFYRRLSRANRRRKIVGAKRRKKSPSSIFSKKPDLTTGIEEGSTECLVLFRAGGHSMKIAGTRLVSTFGSPLLWVLIAAAASLISSPVHVHAAIMTGDQIAVLFTETSPNPGLQANGLITLGPADGGNLFTVSDATVVAGGVCLECKTDFKQDLSGLFFDSATFGLTGMITGSFTGNGGLDHTFDLTFADFSPNPPGNWTFLNTKFVAASSQTTTTEGTYTTGVTPEPCTFVLLGTALAGLGLWKRGKHLLVQRSP